MFFTGMQMRDGLSGLYAGGHLASELIVAQPYIALFPNYHHCRPPENSAEHMGFVFTVYRIRGSTTKLAQRYEL